MKFRKITADYVFTLEGEPLKNGMLVIDDEGLIIDIVKGGDGISEIAGLEKYNGIICPGFVNAHCHLELSHLKNCLPKGTGLPIFLKNINLLRKSKEEEILKLSRQADLFMFRSGTIAVGDISNSSLSLEVKEKSKIYYYTFIEAFGFAPERAPRAMEYIDFVAALYKASRLKCSATPHYAYAVSDDLFRLIINEAVKNRSSISLHHQESAEEDKLFKFKSGGLLDYYENYLNLDVDFWKPTGKSSTKSVIAKIPTEVSLLLVHNTYLGKDDASCLVSSRKSENTFFVTCPNSNIYIEKKLPDYQILVDTGFPICIGTDSLASNQSLSILDEMKTIQKNYPICLNDLLTWACLNGAKALGLNSWAGTLQKGKKPGVNLISGIDLKNMSLSPNSKVIRLA